MNMTEGHQNMSMDLREQVSLGLRRSKLMRSMAFYQHRNFWNIWLTLVFKFLKRQIKKRIWSIIFENWMNFYPQLSIFLLLDNLFVTMLFCTFHLMNARYFKLRNDVLLWFVLKFIVLMKFQKWRLRRKRLRKKVLKAARSLILEEDQSDSNLRMNSMIH